eukprot:scaffold12083_cov139-Isochrysis_galbana.AAC.3
MSHFIARHTNWRSRTPPVRRCLQICKGDTRHIHSAHKTTKRGVLTNTESNVDSMGERGKGSTREH